jgi:S1-C subfamily serine protease
MNKVFIFLFLSIVAANLAVGQTKAPAKAGHHKTDTAKAMPGQQSQKAVGMVKKNVARKHNTAKHGATHEQETIDIENNNATNVIEINNGQVLLNGEVVSTLENLKNEHHKIIIRHKQDEPAERLEPLAPREAKEHYRRAMLGVYAQHSLDNNGATIIDIVPGSPASKAGLSKEDIITKINGTSIKDAQELTDVIGDHDAGETVNIAYERDGKEYHAEVVLAETLASGNGDVTETPLQLGIEARDTKNSNGVMVVYVKKKSPAEKAGLEEGDVIVRIDRQRTKSVDDLLDITNEAWPNKKVIIDFYRGRKLMYTYLRFVKERVKRDF